jgi:O-antigen/teichoic acid export membrane protein
MNLRRLALNAASLAGGGIVAQLCFISIEALIARSLGQEGYGAYGTAYAIALAFVVAADAGMAWKVVESGSRDHTTIAPLFGTTAVLKLTFCLLIYPVSTGLLVLAGYDGMVVNFYAIFFGYAVLIGLQDSLAAVHAARQRMHVSAFFQGLSPVAVLACVALAGLFSATLTTIGIAYLAGAALVTGVWVWRVIVTEHPRVELRQIREILRGSYLYGITALLFQVMLRVDLMLLSWFRDLGEVGLYAAADKLADLGLKVGTMSTRVLAPVLFAQSAHDDASYRRTCKVVLRAVSVFGVLGCLILALAAEPLLAIVFGEPFRAAGVVLVLLALSLVARLVAGTLQAILSASGDHRRRTGSLAAALTMSVAANIALIPVYGIVGAAIARALGDAIYAGAMMGARKLPIPRRDAASWILGPAAIGVTAYLLAPRLPAHFALQLTAALLAYLAGLLVTRMIGWGELRDLLSALRAGAKA